MKRLIAVLFISPFWLLASCGAGDGSLRSCNTSYTGSLEGTLTDREGTYTGMFVALIDDTGRFEGQTTLDTRDPDIGEDGILTSNVDGTVSEDGTVMASGGMDIMGTFDLDTCEGSGTWGLGSSGSLGTGTWRLETPQAAF